LNALNLQLNTVNELEKELSKKEKEIEVIEGKYNDLLNESKRISVPIFSIFNDFATLVSDESDNIQTTAFNDFESLIRRFKTISDSAQELDWKSLYTRSKIQELISDKKVVSQEKFEQGDEIARDERTIERL
ncbi:hypothetical protein ACFL0J_07890, partial [Candidatus Neomarinimicrobiota bacterium]